MTAAGAHAKRLDDPWTRDQSVTPIKCWRRVRPRKKNVPVGNPYVRSGISGELLKSLLCGIRMMSLATVFPLV